MANLIDESKARMQGFIKLLAPRLATSKVFDDTHGVKSQLVSNVGGSLEFDSNTEAYWDYTSHSINNPLWPIAGIQTLKFDAGTTELALGWSVTGGTSGHQASVRAVYVVSGSWAGNDATGILYLSDSTGNFQDNETITTGGGGSATADGTSIYRFGEIAHLLDPSGSWRNWGMDIFGLTTTGRLIQMGAFDNLIASVKFVPTGVDARITLIPYVLDKDINVLGTLSPKVARPYSPTGNGQDAIVAPSESPQGYWNLSPILNWDTFGAYFILVSIVPYSVSDYYVYVEPRANATGNYGENVAKSTYPSVGDYAVRRFSD